YGFVRTLDNTESVASTLASYVRYERDYTTLNRLFRQYDALTPETLHEAAKVFLDDARLVVTTLAHEAMPSAFESAPAIGGPARETQQTFSVIEQPGPSPLVRFKLLFTVGSAHDPAGKEGLATLSAEMITEAGSRLQR